MERNIWNEKNNNKKKEWEIVLTRNELFKREEKLKTLIEI